jgi:Tfp pilus assembly protein PilO
MKIGKLPSMPWYLRLVIFGAIAGAMYAGFWYFVTKGTHEATRSLNAEITVLAQKNTQAQIASQRLNDVKANYKARQEEYEELKALLPEQRELTMVLQGLQDRARATGLVFRKFTPKEDTMQDNYTGKRIEVGVSSSFASLRAFFEQVAHYQRIVSITNFDLKQSDKQLPNWTVDATFDLTAYYASPENLQKAAPAKPGAPGAGGPNAAQQAAQQAAQNK